jgi:pSer/pThr/pTyr-binding forkhead associated (FHA) protein
MKLSLLVLTPGKQEGKILPIGLSQFVIGRDPQCHLRPASPMISKRHCALLQRDGKVFLRDFGSTNGTFVNDEQVSGEVELKEDDKIKVGPLEFTVKIEAKAPVSRPASADEAAEDDEGVKTESGKDVPTVMGGASKTPEKAAEKPAKKPAAKADDEADASPEDDVAAMLLSIGDDSDASPSSGGGVPEGSTVHELKLPANALTDTKEEEKNKGKDEGKDKGKDKAKVEQGNTINAAKSILEKMMRRPR